MALRIFVNTNNFYVIYKKNNWEVRSLTTKGGWKTNVSEMDGAATKRRAIIL